MAGFNEKGQWDGHYEQNAEHIDWLCSYETLRKLVRDHLWNWPPPIPAILLLGTGLSTFAEDLYDSGFRLITVIDFAEEPARVHLQRTERPPRHGIKVFQRDVSDPEWPDVDELGLQYGMVVDKGLIDCLLTSPKGMAAASAAITNVWSRMTTPGVWLSVSHSPPRDRRDLYCLTAAAAEGSSSVYWHQLKVRRVRLPPLEYAAAFTAPGEETVEELAEEGDEGAAGGSPGEAGPGGGRGGGGASAGDGGDGLGVSGFADDVAYIYEMTK
ncbi:hypothetical protein HYH03_009132 [Edaphochlamys debaryana]|uniref:Uncharacterized protein n=1 Tax=Edaphochlamys debaryana TaxID=47281 RepID=A0A835XZS1_9CHLO|nr:hypothetical protein HYH03_009132 [Edaphochlamys debaryana]|eukprot:KAG2492719.1 hypothetical protein HYH03_009132 [Edaphochlamys debaryana]